MVAGCTRALEKHGLPGYAFGVGARGCVTFASRRIRPSLSTPVSS